MIDTCRKNGIEIPELYAPHFSREEDKLWLQDYITNMMLESIVFCKKAGEAGITILIVNQMEDLSGHLVRNELCEPQAAAELIDRLNHDAGRNVFGFCLDTGVCNICGNDIQCFVNTLGDRLKAVVVSATIYLRQ